MLDDNRFVEAMHLKQIDRFEKSNQILQELLAENPTDGMLLYLIAGNHYSMGDYEQALAYSGLSMEHGYSMKDNHYLMAITHHMTDQYQRAETHYLEALRIQPTYAEALSGYGALMMLTGHSAKGTKLLEEAKRLEPENPMVLKQWFNYFQSQEDHSNMEGTLCDIVDNVSDRKSHLIHIMKLKIDENDYKGAFESCREAYLMDPTNQMLLNALRELEITSNPLMRPMHLAAKLGSVKIWIGAIAIMFTLSFLGLYALSNVFITAYLVFCVYSWTINPILKWYYKTFKHR